MEAELAESAESVSVVDSVDEIKLSLWQTIAEMWNSFVGHLPYLLAGLTVVMLTWGITALLTSVGTRLLKNWHKRDSLKELIIRLLSIVVWGLGLILTAIVVFPGLTPSKALGGLGLVSIAVGLAFKDIFENFFAGILMLWRFPFETGDYIECDGINGRVEKVLVRMSYIRLMSGELVVVPNSFLFKKPVKIYADANFRRTSLVVGVSYSADLSEVIEVTKQCLQVCETVADSKPVQIAVANFNSSSMDIEVLWWTDAAPSKVRQSRSEVIITIKNELDRRNIHIPFPIRTLHFADSLEISQ